MKKAIIIGASSGIGMELAKILSREGYVVGLAARKVLLLKQLQNDLPNKSFVKFMDVSKTHGLEKQFRELVAQMGGLDILILSSGTGHINRELDWQKEADTIDVNVLGFTKVFNIALHYFMEKDTGHIAGISSIAAIKGGYDAPAYNASKAFISNYMEGIRIKMKKESRPIIITDIQPGFVNTAMSQGDGLFWVAPADVAAKQIYHAIKKKKDKAYITRRWSIIALLLTLIPDWLYYKI